MKTWVHFQRFVQPWTQWDISLATTHNVISRVTFYRIFVYFLSSVLPKSLWEIQLVPLGIPFVSENGDMEFAQLSVIK